jgi:hypothetical protein
MNPISRVWVGIVLTGVVWIVSACVILFFLGGGLFAGNNPFIVDDQSQNLKFLSSICAILFSFAYFWKLRRQSKSILSIHFLLTVVVLLYFGYQYITIRTEQHQVLMKYQELRQALLDEDYQRAYDLMTPSWRQENSVTAVIDATEGFIELGPEDSVYSVHIYEGMAEIVPSPKTSWWFRSSMGNSWLFEKVDSEWYIYPRSINFYLANP